MSVHSKRLFTWLIFLLIVGATFAAYWQVRHFEFTGYDDEDYVSRNPMVLQGLTLESARWALTTTHFSYWHPLTWLSHILDVELFGLDAGKHHLTNVVLHGLATLALFGALRRLTQQQECSLVVAALFALHPLHVESVAWIAERKDVLSTLFWFLTLWSYAWYTQRPGWSRYLMTLSLFALGLMSKPMLVTVPCVLLLLDFWPLRRLRLRPDAGPWFTEKGVPGLWRQIRELSPVHPGKLVLEKIPFLVLALISSAITFIGVYSTNRVLGTEAVSLGLRLANVPVSYVRYLGKMILPENMVVLYPMPDSWETWQVVGSCVLLLVITVVAVASIRRAPYLLVGWLWYLGTLVPTIGIIPVGFHSIADRYTYVPLVGVFVMAVWGVADLSADWPFRRRILAAAATVILLLFTLGTWMQTRHWRNDLTLFGHAVNVSTNNALAHYNLGLTLQLQGRWAESIRHYRESTRIQPGDVKPRINLAYVYNQLGLFEESTNALADVLRRQPGNVDALLNLGVALSSMGSHEEALVRFEEVLRLQPDRAAAHYQRGRAWERQGRFAEAMESYERAVRAKDEFAEAWLRLAWLRAAHPDEAIRNPVEALGHARRVGELIGHGHAAGLLALAAAQAANDDFDAARETAQRALALAREAGLRPLAKQCEEVLESAAQGRAYTDDNLTQELEP